VIVNGGLGLTVDDLALLSHYNEANRCFPTPVIA
jgi:molybdopterin-biosynthesis enzyme MoeA-like protein